MNQMAKYSWVFLVLGLLSLVVLASAGFVTAVAGGELGDLSKQLMLGSGSATLAFLGIFAWLDFQSLKSGASSRTFQYGLASLVTVFIAFGIATGGYLLSKDHDHRWDLTREKRFSISEKTLSVVGNLDKDVEIWAFFKSGSPEEERFKTLMEAYTQASPHVTVHYVDPLRQPRMAAKFTVTSEYGTVVMESGDSRQRLESDFSEEKTTAALIRLTAGNEHRICWSTGHGEADPDDDQSPQGLGFVVVKMEDQNYTVTKTNVLTTGIDRRTGSGESPGCEALVIAAPQEDWLPIERERLAVYLAEGGRALILLEPDTVPDLAADLERYGVQVGNDVVLDPSPSNRMLGIDDPTHIVLSQDNYATHPITKPLKAVTLFGIARSAGGVKGAEGLVIHDLITASDKSWGETVLDPTDPDAGVPNEGTDLVGNVPIMVAVEITDPSVLGVGMPTPPAPAPAPADVETPEGDAPADVPPADAPPADAPAPAPDLASLLGAGAAVPADFSPQAGGRLVVVGDSDFASNRLVTIGNNQDLFVNSIAWLVEQEDQISEGPEDESDTLTLNLIEEALLWLFSVFLVPGASVALAVLVRLRRQFL